MNRKQTLTKALAVLGTVIVWLPLLAPFAFGALAFSTKRGFRFDYLMPAELFPVVMLGGGLLFWAALRAHSRRGLIGGGLAAAAALLVGGQALAVVTGLASGAIEPAGWPWVLVLASLGLYALSLVAAGVGGGLLLRDLFKRQA
jgi:hypothetical protein